MEKMTEEEMMSLEETFVERHFELGDDFATVTMNLKKAEEIYNVSYSRVNSIARDITDGVMIDPYEADFLVQTLCFASKYKKRFVEQLNEVKK